MPAAPAPSTEDARRSGGTTKKSKKQKGGGARHGALTAPIFVGGGVTFAAAAQLRAEGQPQDVPRRHGAILSELNRQGRLTVVESLGVERPRPRV
jgi:large subunit ribosomal protein L4